LRWKRPLLRQRHRVGSSGKARNKTRDETRCASTHAFRRGSEKLAEKQAKAWAEAEQRSVKDHEERAVRQQQQASHVAKEVPASEPDASLFHGQIGAGLFVVALIALFAVPYVLPMQGYATRIDNFSLPDCSSRYISVIWRGVCCPRASGIKRCVSGESKQ